MGNNGSRPIVNKIISYNNNHPIACGRDMCWCLISLNKDDKERMEFYKSCYDTWYNFNH